MEATNETIFMMWIIIWVIFLVMSIIEIRGVVFGFLSGLWILFLGIYVYIDGLQYQTGMQIVTLADTQTVTYTYTDVVAPFSNYGILWAIPFILLGIYIMYLASMKRRKGT